MRIPLSQFGSWTLQDNESPYIGTVSAFRHTSSYPIASWVYPILREKPMSSSLSSVPKSLPTSITTYQLSMGYVLVISKSASVSSLNSRSEVLSRVSKSSAAFPVQIQSSQFSNCVGNTFGKSQSFPDSLDPGLVLLARVHLQVAALQLGPEHGQFHRVNHLEGGQVLDGAQLVAVQE